MHAFLRIPFPPNLCSVRGAVTAGNSAWRAIFDTPRGALRSQRRSLAGVACEKETLAPKARACLNIFIEVSTKLVLIIKDQELMKIKENSSAAKPHIQPSILAFTHRFALQA